jgi:ABC-type phosphate transport system substrate-binding protein
MADLGKLAVLGSLFVAACAPTSRAIPTLTPYPEVSVGPSALPFSLNLASEYQDRSGPLPFDLVPMATSAGIEAAAAGEVLFHIDFAPVPDGWFAVPLGWEGIAIVVNSEAGIRQLSSEELVGLFSGRSADWDITGEPQGPVQLVVPVPGDRLLGHFGGLIGLAQPPPTAAILAPVPEATFEYLRGIEGSIGLLPFNAGIPDDLRALRIDGTLPSESTIRNARYPLRVQVIAMAPDEPDQEAIAWLSWAQGRLEDGTSGTG